MLDPERSFFTPNNSEFQPIIGYAEIEKSPPIIVRQTDALLGLFYQGAIRHPEPAKDYLHNYTLGYLTAAEIGSSALYSQIGGATAQNIALETREAAHHAFIVFASLPDKAKSPYLTKGFSRKGLLRAPVTHKEFLARIKEIKIGISLVVSGNVEPYVTLEAYPPILRTFKFFKVGDGLLIKLTDEETRYEQLEREKFNDLLGGIDISL